MCNTTPSSVPALWGTVLALLEAGTPGGLDDAARPAFFAAPAEHLAGLGLAATAMTPRLRLMLDAATAKLDKVPCELSAAEQSEAWLAYTKTRAEIGSGAGMARPAKRAWEFVDWSLPDAEIARRMGVHPASVLRQRRKRGK